MVIDNVMIDVPQPGPPNIFYHPKIEFYESSEGYEATASISIDNNTFFESEPPMVIGTDTFTFQFGSVTLGDCIIYCDLESNYFGTILGGANRTFDYEITTAGNGDKTLVIVSPEGDIAVHGDFILANSDFEQSRISIFPNPVENELQLVFQGFTVSDVKIISIKGKRISGVQFSENNTIDVSYFGFWVIFLGIEGSRRQKSYSKILKAIDFGKRLLKKC